MFERFTKQALSVVSTAVEIAGRHGDDRIRPDHLLLAVATAPETSLQLRSYPSWEPPGRR